MEKRGLFLAGLLILICCSISSASITNLTYGTDGDGAITNCYYTWDSGNVVLSMYGDQAWGPGHMLGTFYTDSPDDPTLSVRNTLDNDTSFAWTDYHVNVFMSSTFTLSNAVVYTPGDWGAGIITQPTLIGSNYVGRIDYYAGTPVAIGNTLDFSYKMIFSGATQFTYTQELIPTPEPSTFALLACGLVMGGFALVNRRRNHSK